VLEQATQNLSQVRTFWKPMEVSLSPDSFSGDIADPITEFPNDCAVPKKRMKYVQYFSFKASRDFCFIF
jgi:hypothetical protein